MAREIKFRAWSKQKNKMFYATLGKGCFMTNGEWWSIGEDYDKSYASSEYKDALMQFTNLRDKNGQEIYEGDALGGIYSGCYIAYCDTCKQFQLVSPEFGCMACLGEISWWELVEDRNSGNLELEIVGNIYDNPELLEVANNG